MKKTEFETLKADILQRAKAVGACKDEYKRAEQANDIKELAKVVSKNILFCLFGDIININNIHFFTPYIKEHKVEVSENSIELFYKNSQLRVKANYKDGNLHGFYEEWYDNGKCFIKTNYKDDKLHGLFEQWSNKGHLESKVECENDEEIKDYLSKETICKQNKETKK